MNEATLKEIWSGVTIAIPIIAVIFVAIFFLIRRHKSKNMKLKEQGLLGKGAKGQGIYEGVEYSYLHFQGGKNAPPYFNVTIVCPSSGIFKITRETRFDRFCKKLGICTKLETQDREFDDTFFITTDTIGFTRDLFSKSEKRRLVMEIFAKGFTEIKYDGKKMMANWISFPRNKLMEIKAVEEIASLLGQLGRDMPHIYEYETETPENAGWKQKRFIAFALPILLLAAGIAGMIIGLTSYIPLDEGIIILNSFKYSIPCLFLFLWAVILLLKGRTSSHRELIPAMILSILGFILGGMGGGITLNGWLDNGKPTAHEVKVINKYYSKNKNSFTYYAAVESWREGQYQEKIKVSRSFYDYLEPGGSRMIITTKPGKFGFEWLVNYKARGADGHF